MWNHHSVTSVVNMGPRPQTSEIIHCLATWDQTVLTPGHSQNMTCVCLRFLLKGLLLFKVDSMFLFLLNKIDVSIHSESSDDCNCENLWRCSTLSSNLYFHGLCSNLCSNYYSFYGKELSAFLLTPLTSLYILSCYYGWVQFYIDQLRNYAYACTCAESFVRFW